MSKGRHRKASRTWFTWKMALASIVALGVTLVACAAGAPSPAQSQETPKPNDWKPSSVSGMEYACDIHLGLFTRHTWEQFSTYGGADRNWSVSFTALSQLSGTQIRDLCQQ